YIDITTRMQIELRYLKIEDIPTIFEKLQNAGLTTYQTGTHNFRNIVADSLDEIALDNIIPTNSIMQKISNLFIEKNEWIGSLPRKFNIGILGSVSNRCNIYGQDCAFVLAQKNGIFGFNVYLGGKVGEVAKYADVFLTIYEIEIFTLSLANIFKKYGFRDNRNKNRLFYFIQEIGMENLISEIKKDANYNFQSGGITYVNMEQFDPAFGKIILKDGSFAVHFITPAGIFSGSDMIECENLCEKYGGFGLRLTTEQKFYIAGIKKENINELLSEKIFLKYKNSSSPYFNNIVACAGTEHCSYGVIPNKPDAIEMAEYLSQKIPLDDGKIRLYWSGCPKGCGTHGIGDIGFEGCKAKENGESVYGVNIFLGGKITNEGKEAKQLLKSISLASAKPIVKELVEVYKNLKRKNESFEAFESRVFSKYSTGAIGFLMKYNYLCEKKSINFKLELSQEPESAKNESFEIFSFGEQLYKKITGVKPYDSIKDFRPSINQKPSLPSKITSSFPKELDEIILKMIHPAKEKAYQVFSELIFDLESVNG
ncbi:MAG: ferredoxin-nitrite reductase, partial [Campylobacterota bacterium]|nr:ferredoxin-nitrite reductase [Campylobacterota bacterium]